MKLDKKNQDLESVDEDLLTPDLIRIDLSKNRLRNPLPDLRHLVDLRWINLSKNALTSLDSIANLPSLQVLNVSYNQLAGKLSVGKLRDLTALVLNGNQITSVGGLEKLNKLETLIISNNAVSDLGGWIASATSLTKLSASNNPVEDFSGLASLKRMKELRLNSTGIQHVGRVVQELSKLRILEVGGGNRIERFEDVGSLPNGLWQLNLKGTPLSASKDYEDEVVLRYSHLDVIDGRRRREKGGGGRGGGKSKVETMPKEPKDVNFGAKGKIRTEKSVTRHFSSTEQGSRPRHTPPSRGPVDGEDVDDDDDEALDPGAFKVTNPISISVTEAKTNKPKKTKMVAGDKASRQTAKKAKTTTSTKKKPDLTAVLHGDKTDQLSTW